MTKQTAQEILDFIEGPRNVLFDQIEIWEIDANDTRKLYSERAGIRTVVADANKRLKRMDSWIEQLTQYIETL